MCDPITIASIGAQVVGAQIQNNATKDANRSMAMMMDQNAAKNRALEDSQAAAIQGATAVAGADAGKTGMGEASNAIADALRSTIINAAMKGPAQGVSTRNGPQIIQDAIAGAAAEAQAKAEAQASAVAQLDGINQYLTTTVTPKIADSAVAGALTGNFMRGESNVLDAGMKYAQSKAYSPTAQILSGLGQVGTAYGLYEDKIIDPNKGTA